MRRQALIRDRWEVVGGQAVNCLRTFAREFRYDTGRARYLMRDLDLATLQPSASYAGLWTDYAQDTAHGDQIGEHIEVLVNDAVLGLQHTLDSRLRPGDRITLLGQYMGG
mgnify:CR=1 FL=1